jgi:hypothetical protein
LSSLPSVNKLSVIMHNAICCYANFHYTDCHYALVC